MSCSARKAFAHVLSYIVSVAFIFIITLIVANLYGSRTLHVVHETGVVGSNQVSAGDFIAIYAIVTRTEACPSIVDRRLYTPDRSRVYEIGTAGGGKGGVADRAYFEVDFKIPERIPMGEYDYIAKITTTCWDGPHVVMTPPVRIHVVAE